MRQPEALARIAATDVADFYAQRQPSLAQTLTC
jgi:hypothetical protein